jgi:predicted metal-binding membrane protein
MGLRHGAYCTACCRLLMAVLFVVGIMNLAWIVAFIALVLAEKLLPDGERRRPESRSPPGASG